MHSAKQSGSPSTVLAGFLHFDLCFTVWVLLGALGVFIVKDMHLNEAQKGLMVAIPVLSGSIARFPIGILGDRYGAKNVGIGLLAFLFIPLLIGWLLPVNFPGIIVVGLMLGTAGSSFAVSLPLASRWYPPERQGLVMGLAAAGNIGTVVANLSAPSLAKAYGWHNVLGQAMIPLAIILVAFILLAKESPNRPKDLPLSVYMKALRSADMWWFCIFYSITFGGFVGLGSFLPLFFNKQYGIAAVDAGFLTAAAGSTLRPLGGYLSDKIGGVRMLTVLFTAVALLYAAISFLLPLSIASWLIIVLVGCLGLGNGSMFQLVPLRFTKEIGVATGLIGAIGGLGGFFLPNVLGSAKQFTGSFTPGLISLAVVSFLCLILLRVLVGLHRDWRFSWNDKAAGKELAAVEAAALEEEIVVSPE